MAAGGGQFQGCSVECWDVWSSGVHTTLLPDRGMVLSLWECMHVLTNLPAVAGTPRSFSSELTNFSTQGEREFKLKQAAFNSPGGGGRLRNLTVLNLWTVLLA